MVVRERYELFENHFDQNFATIDSFHFYSVIYECFCNQIKNLFPG